MAPKRAGLVLVSLILVAAVANLNLSVANVALPSIGTAFDSSQTTLNLIAVGYSLGLAASVLWLGAIGDRYGRKLLLVLGMLLSVPASLLAAYAPSDEVLFVARLVGGFSAGMAYPTTLALITALWAGPGRTRSIALWSAIGGGIAALGPLVAGAAPGALLVGLGLPRHPAARRVRPGDGDPLRPQPRQRDHGARRQPRRNPLAGHGRDVDPRDQLRAGPQPGRARGRAARDRARHRDRIRAQAAPRAESPLRPPRRVAPDLLGRRVRRDHRLRLADGGGVREPAVPPERARLLDGGGRRRDPPRDRLHDPRGAALREARRGERAPASRCSPATSSCCSPSCRCSSSGRREARTGRSASPTSSSGSASVSPGRRRRTRSPGRSRCSGRGWPRARPTCSATSGERS